MFLTGMANELSFRKFHSIPSKRDREENFIPLIRLVSRYSGIEEACYRDAGHDQPISVSYFCPKMGPSSFKTGKLWSSPFRCIEHKEAGDGFCALFGGCKLIDP